MNELNENLLSFKDGRGNFSFEIKLSENRYIDKDTGYLYCDNAIFGHTGVQEYYGYELGMGDSQDIVKVHRLAEDVFSDEAMASIEGKSITMQHPSEGVNNKNYRMLEVGTILKVWRDGDNVVGKIVIKDMDAIEAIIDGTYESLSLGYRAKLVPMEDGNSYKQTNLVINHLAIVAKGRAKNARIMDSELEPKRKENRPMNLLNWLFGKRIKLHEDGTFNVLQDEDKKEKDVEASDDKDVERTLEDAKRITKSKTVVEEESMHDDETGESTTKRTVSEETHSEYEDDGAGDSGGEKPTPLVDSKEDEKPKGLKLEDTEKENSEMTQEERKAFKDDMRAEILQELKEVEGAKPKENVFHKTEVIETKVEDDGAKDQLRLDFDRDEKLRKIFWDKYTNPMAHGGDFKEFETFRKRANSIVTR